jgi:hypothetical protein
MEHIYVHKRASALSWLDFDNINSGLYGVVDDDCAFSAIHVTMQKERCFSSQEDYTTELFSLSIFLRSRTKSDNAKHIGKCCCDWSMEEEFPAPLFLTRFCSTRFGHSSLGRNPTQVAPRVQIGEKEIGAFE